VVGPNKQASKHTHAWGAMKSH